MIKKILILLLIAQTGWGQQTFTLNQLVAKAIEQSKLLKTDAIKLDLAKNGLESVNNGRLPDVNASGQFMYLPIAPNVD